jgi:hypothetical protein
MYLQVPRHEHVRKVEVKLNAFWTSTVDRDVINFTSGIEASSTHWTEGWVGTRVGLDAVSKTEEIRKQIWSAESVHAPVNHYK